MFNKFTTKSQEAIISAQVIANENGQPHIESLHLLLALLDQDESLVKTILEKLRIDPEEVADKTEMEIRKLPKIKIEANLNGPMNTVQGNGETAMILERAKKEADLMKDEFISTEHILLALIGVQSPAQTMLLSFNVD